MLDVPRALCCRRWLAQYYISLAVKFSELSSLNCSHVNVRMDYRPVLICFGAVKYLDTDWGLNRQCVLPDNFPSRLAQWLDMTRPLGAGGM